MLHLRYYQTLGSMYLGEHNSNAFLSTKLVGTGYSGYPPHVNDPLAEALKGLGPIPKGWYVLGKLYPKHPHLGPYVIELIPDDDNVMFDRSGFFMHGDNKANPGYASHGCIIMPRPAREFAYTKVPSRRLQVL